MKPFLTANSKRFSSYQFFFVADFSGLFLAAAWPEATGAWRHRTGAFLQKNPLGQIFLIVLSSASLLWQQCHAKGLIPYLNDFGNADVVLALKNVETAVGITLKDVIRSDKSDIDVGPWNVGHLPRSAFPLSKVKPSKTKYGQSYKWRIIKFSALGRKFRVCLLLNSGKMIFRSTLAIEGEVDMTILCKHEYHAGEPGWHCHLSIDDSDKIMAGVRDPDQLRRWPQIEAKHSKMDWNITEANAVTIVAERYKIKAQGELL